MYPQVSVHVLVSLQYIIMHPKFEYYALLKQTL